MVAKKSPKQTCDRCDFYCWSVRKMEAHKAEHDDASVVDVTDPEVAQKLEAAKDKAKNVRVKGAAAPAPEPEPEPEPEDDYDVVAASAPDEEEDDDADDAAFLDAPPPEPVRKVRSAAPAARAKPAVRFERDAPAAAPVTPDALTKDMKAYLKRKAAKYVTRELAAARSAAAPAAPATPEPTKEAPKDTLRDDLYTVAQSRLSQRMNNEVLAALMKQIGSA